jgi:hypothetical protein
MNRIEELGQQIDAELEALEATLDDYEQTLADIDGTLSNSRLSDTESVDRRIVTGPTPASAD